MKRLREGDLRLGLRARPSKRARARAPPPQVPRRGTIPSGRMAAAFEPELKNHDVAISFPVDSTMEVPTTGQLSLIAQGDDQNTRDGRQVVIKSIHLRLQAAYAPATAVAGAVPTTTLGVWLVLDTQPNGAAATPTDVLNVSGTTLVASWRKNLDNDRRFQILKFFEFTFGNTGNWVADGSTALGRTEIQEFYKKINLPILYSGSTGVITAVSTNNLFLIAAAQGSDDLCTVSGMSRLRFVG